MQFLHRLDGLRDEAQWVETRAGDLARASFLDGRETFWSRARVAPVDPHSGGPEQPIRIVFHVGFCGSTLLTRLLEERAGVLALREPQALTDLASQQAQLVDRRGAEILGRLLDFALAHLAGTGESEPGVGRTTVIKPSNWVNGLAPVFARPGQKMHALCMTMDRRAYLRAVFRGGRDRIAFALRHVQLLAASDAALADRLRAAIAHNADPLDQAARATALLHRAQEDLFAGLSPREEWLAFETLLEQPHRALAHAGRLLGIAVEGDGRGAGLPAADAKDPSRTFSPETRHGEDALVERHHGARFDAALGWLGSAA